MVAGVEEAPQTDKEPFSAGPCAQANPATTDLVRAEQRPAELPCLCRRLRLVQPLLGDGLMFHVWVKVQLVESLTEEKRIQRVYVSVAVDKSNKI